MQYRIFIIWIAVLLHLSVTSLCTAQFLNENFELELSDLWQFSPMEPTVYAHSWGVEDSTIFIEQNPGDHRSLWCSGFPNDLIPGNDLYIIDPDQPAWAIYGPFPLENYLIAEPQFDLWSDAEWDDGLRVVCTNHPEYSQQHETLEDLQNWCVLGEYFGRTPAFSWQHLSFDFAHVDSSGIEISYLGRENVYLAFVFIEDGDEEAGYGAFIDNLYMYPIFDHQFDFRNPEISIRKSVDGNYVTPDDILMGEEYFIICSFRVRDIVTSQTEESTHRLTLAGDTEDWVGEWEALPENNRFEEYLLSPWVPDHAGEWQTSFELDIYNDQDEINEGNNLWDLPIIVQGPPNTWFNPFPENSDTLISSQLTIQIFSETPFEELDFEFFLDNDRDFENGAIPIWFELLDLEPPSVLSSIEYRTRLNGSCNGIEDGEYYLVASVSDGVFPDGLSYSESTIVIAQEVLVGGKAGILLSSFMISEPYPNPFNNEVNFSISLTKPGKVNIAWIDLLGRLVDRQSFNFEASGNFKQNWQPSSLASGIYLAQISTNHGNQWMKVIYLP
ncbi:T9SS type A sorting domain-containing protein [bacterium]|nr:T9SS type A sorting domain-containing protein [bacterium]